MSGRGPPPAAPLDHGRVSDGTDCGGTASGFSIVEVLVAVVILSLGLLTLMGFATFTVKEFNRSQKVALATTAAREHLDSLRHLEYDDLTLGDATVMVTTGDMQLWITRVVEKPKLNLKKITVSVVDNEAHEYQRYITYVYNEKPE